MFLFEACSPNPLTVHTSVCPEAVIGAVFIPNKQQSHSTLYFMRQSQVLCCLETEDEEDSGNTEQSVVTIMEDKLLPSERAFNDLFGDTKTPSKSDWCDCT